jgi:hypothetical protein
MAKQIINIGSVADDGTGSTLRAGGDISNDNFNEIYTKLGDGTTLYSLTFPNATDTIVGRNTSDTLTNKTISGSSNTISNIANSSLTNSGITLVDESSSSTVISLGETLKITGGTGLATSISGDTLTIDFDSNAVFNGIDLNGTELILDADADTSITADTDDQIDIKIGGNDRITLQSGIIDLKNDGSESQIKLYCQVGNAHYTQIQASPHANYGGGSVTVVVPAVAGTLALRPKTTTATGDGSTVAFTLTNINNDVNSVMVFLNGVLQRPTTDYTVSGTTLTFGTAPANLDAITIKEF